MLAVAGAMAVISALLCAFVVYQGRTREALHSVALIARTSCGQSIRIAIREDCTISQAFAIYRQFVDIFQYHDPVTASAASTTSKPTEEFKPATLVVTFLGSIYDALYVLCDETSRGYFTHRMAHKDAQATVSNPALDAELERLAGQMFEIDAISARWGIHMFYGMCDDHTNEQEPTKEAVKED